MKIKEGAVHKTDTQDYSHIGVTGKEVISTSTGLLL